jgi:26S proteasome regulatory subunit N3
MQTIEKAVSTKESRYMSRVVRQVTKLRRMLSKPVLTKTVETYIAADSTVREQLVGYLACIADEKMQVETPAAPPADAKKEEEPAEKTEDDKAKEKEEAAFVRKMQGVPEAEILIQLLFTIFLLDKKCLSEATNASSSLIQRAQHFNRRTTDQLLSKGYFYWARCIELSGRSAQIRNELLAAYRTAALKHDQIGQATLLNLLLRNYLEFNLYEQADTLMRKTSFPEGDASNNQLARYLYYTGRIKAVQLEYTDAFRSLQQAARKSPQQSALGFRKTVHKFIVIVQLLLGEIPDRSIFSQKGMVAALTPYLHICQAVRVGDLASFKKAMQVKPRTVVPQRQFRKLLVFPARICAVPCALTLEVALVTQEFGETFKTDQTYSLIVRLRHNVIKTGLKKINMAYSHISLVDVCAKLALESVQDTEYIVAKCIQDGVIDAVIDHESQAMMSKANLDIYSTSDPQIQLHKRVAFCLDMHNQAVKAMRYAENTKAEWESAEERRERLKQEEEMMNSMEEDDDF